MMKVRVGFLHNRKMVKVSFRGKFSLNGEFSDTGETVEDAEVIFEIINSVPAEYDWYEKTDTFYDIEKMESVRSKYYIDDIPVRVIKVGKSFGNKDNFEYWVLKKTSDMEDKIYPSGDYRFKKLIKKEASGVIRAGKKDHTGKILCEPLSAESSFTVKDVSVGIDFHWDHKEDLEYSGSLEIMTGSKGLLTAVNIIELEEYLASVNSSEMRNDNNIEMLKAQTVAARSTVIATMGKHHFCDGFDLCADDHCQCYQGTKKMSALSRRVAQETEGEVLMFDSGFADARYAKICGGITERYSTCWENMDFPYLAAFSDDPESKIFHSEMSEADAGKFIEDHESKCFCNTFRYTLPESLDFCKDLFRWETEITPEEIKANLKSKFGVQIGSITGIKPLKRGYSGRIFELEVEGSEGVTVISKELNIRRLLSKTHLPSSAFIISELDGKYILRGAGWGHGVGLCQIGAQIMGEKGYGYRDILKHYYKGSVIRKI